LSRKYQGFVRQQVEQLGLLDFDRVRFWLTIALTIPMAMLQFSR
jgi:hypothetical protein